MAWENVQNILNTLKMATPGQYEYGRNWYSRASAEIRRRLYWLPMETACGMVAALSPQTPWARNIRYAEALAMSGGCPSTRQRRDKALSILRGEATPRGVLNASTNNYGKERSFFECLLDPANTQFVAVDGHAWSIWAGRRVHTSRTPHFHYGEVAQAYFEAADIAGLTGCQTQAITWITWRHLHRVRREYDRDEWQMWLGFMEFGRGVAA
jgi:hypothetical protein